MIRVLANDGLDTAAVNLLTQKGFEVVTKKIEQKDLPAHIAQFDAVVLRSATRIGAAELELTGKLKLIVRAGVGTDNIDTQTAAKKMLKFATHRLPLLIRLLKWCLHTCFQAFACCIKATDSCRRRALPVLAN